MTTPKGGVRALEPMRSLLNGPAIAEPAIVLDAGKGRVHRAKLLPNSLDEGADVDPVAVLAASGDEVLAVHDVVELAVGHVLARLERQPRHHAELGDGEIDHLAAPERTAPIEAQCQAAEPYLALLRLRRPDGPLTRRDQLDAFQERLGDARLLDIVDGATGERRLLVGVIV